MVLLKNNAPRWVIFFIDLSICVFSIFLAYLLRFNFAIPQVEIDTLGLVVSIITGTRAISFVIARTYAGIIRYTSSKDVQRIFVVITSGTLVFGLINLSTYLLEERFYIPFSILIIEYMTTCFFMIVTRVVVKVLYFEFKNPNRLKTNVIIYGAGELGIITKRTLDRDAGTKYKVRAFIDDDKKKAGKKLEGAYIHHTSELDELLKESNIAHVVIAIKNVASEKKKDIVEKCLLYKTKVLNVPPVFNWINGELSFKQIKKVNIEDLLERDPIQLDTESIRKQIANKIILVTGAAGSIGSEIVRQIVPFHPKKIILLDQSESPLYELELELIEKLGVLNIEVVIGDIRNKERMERLFDAFHPDVVYHAAAYKHVPIMENNPSEAVFTNVCGSKVIADLAVKFKVKEFVFISTDKAVNPTNVMGASKRIAEMYIQSLNQIPNSTTKFITTRFGNVLGSNGSVIPRFKKQIDKGGPVTITHPDITRYFMTIPEACQLVLEAGAMGNGGEIFIFDMGKSVKILDLAKKMISLSGLTLGKDIQITYTGLRPGEKLYEELLNQKENTVATHHPQILIAKVQQYDFSEIEKEINTLIALFKDQKNKELVYKMKEIVPEYKSNNSIYEELDKPEIRLPYEEKLG